MYIIAGAYRRHSLISPKNKKTRPTSNQLREALFNICQHKVEGASFLDLFAGSGAMGLEALSRGAAFATFIDNDKESIHCIKSNIENLKVENKTQVLKGDAFVTLKWLEKQKKVFDLIYADPPYRTPLTGTSKLLSTEIISWIDQHDLLSSSGYLFLEEDFHSQPKLDNLFSLIFKNSRRFGDSALQQYQKI